MFESITLSSSCVWDDAIERRHTLIVRNQIATTAFLAPPPAFPQEQDLFLPVHAM